MNRNLKITRWRDRIAVLACFAILMGLSGCVSSGDTQAKSTADLIQDASGKLANQLAVNLSSDQKLRVGILPFTEKSAESTQLAQALQESLKNRLFLSRRFDVVEETDMKKVLKELQIQEQGEAVLREDTIHRMGELLGADAILVSTITTFNSDYLVFCRLIPVKSGVVNSAGEVKIAKEKVDYNWQRGIGDGAPSSPNDPGYTSPGGTRVITPANSFSGDPNAGWRP